MKVKTIILPSVLLLLLLLTGCSFAVSSELYCQSNSDCVPSSCCHPSQAVNKENAPDCKGISCTAVCQPGTLDCGQGSVKCIEKQCQVVLESIGG